MLRNLMFSARPPYAVQNNSGEVALKIYREKAVQLYWSFRDRGIKSTAPNWRLHRDKYYIDRPYKTRNNVVFYTGFDVDSYKKYGFEVEDPPVGKECGWYCDISQINTISACVVKWRCSKGILFIPATKNAECCEIGLHMNDSFIVNTKGKTDELENEGTLIDSFSECYRDSCRITEILAEEYRAQSLDDEARYQTDCLIDEIKNTRKDIRTNIQVIRRMGDLLTEEEVKTIKKAIYSLWLDKTQNQKRIQQIKDEPWILEN